MVWIKEGKLSGFDEITTSFRTYGLDQLWLGSLCFGLRVESLGVANRGFATNFASWRAATHSARRSLWTPLYALERFQYP